MKRVALSLALLVALASTAGAADKYASPTGASAHNGTSGNEWNLTEMNANAAAGDLVHLAAGDYGGALAPANQGSMGSSYIRFVGPTPTLTNGIPDSATASFTAVNIAKGGIVLQYARCAGLLRLYGTAQTINAYARNDSICNCVIGGGVQVEGAKRVVIYGNRIRGEFTTQTDAVGAIGWRACSAGDCDATSHRSSDSLLIRRNRVDVGTVTVSSGTDLRSFSFWGYTRHCTVDSNTVTWKVTSSGTVANSAVLYWMANVSNLAFKDNHTYISGNYDAASQGAGGHVMAFYIRDSTSACTWTRDTIEAVGTGEVYSELGSGGSFPKSGPRALTQHDNWFDQCYFKVTGDITWPDTPMGFKVTRSVFASRFGSPLSFRTSSLDSVYFVNNTFYSGNQNAFYVGFDGTPFTVGNGAVSNKNLYLTRLGSPLSGCSTDKAVVRWHHTPMPSDSNAFFSFAGDSSHAIGDTQDGCRSLGSWIAAHPTMNDNHSRWMNPAVHDTAWATLNLRPLTPSSPLLTTFGGTYIGAYADTGGTTVGVAFAITSSALSGGSITPDGYTLVVAGDSQAYTITPAGGFHVADVSVDGASVGAVTSYTFTAVSAAHNIVASFVADSPDSHVQVTSRGGPCVCPIR